MRNAPRLAGDELLAAKIGAARSTFHGPVDGCGVDIRREPNRRDGGPAVASLPNPRARLRAVVERRRRESPRAIHDPGSAIPAHLRRPASAWSGSSYCRTATARRSSMPSRPSSVANGLPIRRQPVLGTVLFTDIVGSTERQAAAGDREWADVIRHHHAIVREALEQWQGVENDTAGDGFYATFDGPARAIRCALDIMSRVGEIGLDIRAGIHTGECEVVDGKQRRARRDDWFAGRRDRRPARGSRLAYGEGSDRRERILIRGQGGARVEGSARALAALSSQRLSSRGAERAQGSFRNTGQGSAPGMRREGRTIAQHWRATWRTDAVKSCLAPPRPTYLV